MITSLHLDTTDRKILSLLMKDARISYLEIGRECGISGPAVHQRMSRLKESEIISGSQLILNPSGMGFMSCAFIGIQVNLTSNSTHEEVFRKIREIPEIVECHHISGKYSLLVKVFTRNNEHLKKVIVEKIQSIPEITYTESFISLELGFERQIPVEENFEA
jgi:Lrp/AsnC family transcriptional regulator, regulator for asnA, asnC and gidA